MGCFLQVIGSIVLIYGGIYFGLAGPRWAAVAVVVGGFSLIVTGAARARKRGKL